MDNEIPIGFSFKEITERFGPVGGKSVQLKFSFYDWILTETQNSTSTIKVIRDRVLIKAIGRNVRTFKPGYPFTIQVSFHNFWHRRLTTTAAGGAQFAFDCFLVVCLISVSNIPIKISNITNL